MVHPVTKQMYDKANFDYTPKTEDYVRMNFDRETKDKPRRYRIDQMYRVKHIDRDYILYNQTIINSDFPGNQKTCPELVGIHEEPVFEKRYDEDTGNPRAVAVAENKTIYDIPATKENILAILNGTYGGEEKKTIVPHNTNFVLVNDNAKYGGFTLDEFANRHFEDLLFKAINGIYQQRQNHLEIR